MNPTANSAELLAISIWTSDVTSHSKCLQSGSPPSSSHHCCVQLGSELALWLPQEEAQLQVPGLHTLLLYRRFRTLNFRTAKFRLLKEFLDEISWEEVFRDKGAEPLGYSFWEQKGSPSVRIRRQAGKLGSHHGLARTCWSDREKNSKYGLWKQGFVTWEEYRDDIQTRRGGIRKDKARMELNLRNVKKKTRRGSIDSLVRRDRPKRVYLLC